MDAKNTITFIVGPTASGKTQWALERAAQEKAVILNGDSLQVFRGLDIGTAKPSQAEREICPHFLFDIVELGGSFTAGQYRRAALEVIEKEIAKHNIFIVGGSGFYLQALEKGMFEVEAVPDEVVEAIEAEVESQGLEAKWLELQSRDPEASQKIHPNDQYRIVRALSVIRHSGQTWTALQKKKATSTERLSDHYFVKKIV